VTEGNVGRRETGDQTPPAELLRTQRKWMNEKSDKQNTDNYSQQ